MFILHRITRTSPEAPSEKSGRADRRVRVAGAEQIAVVFNVFYGSKGIECELKRTIPIEGDPDTSTRIYHTFSSSIPSDQYRPHRTSLGRTWLGTRVP